MSIIEELAAEPATRAIIKSEIEVLEQSACKLGELILSECERRDDERRQKAQKITQARIEVQNEEEALVRLEDERTARKKRLRDVEEDTRREQARLKRRKAEAVREVKVTEQDAEDARVKVEAAKAALQQLEG